ncbi:asparagine synthase (glutamine-hydrolyzing), partial [bacterium]|nr:asparagine synthase (glutamine-hydrolyzing) [bacterium]
MCGISGAVNFEGLNPDTKNNVLKINNSMCHRGPDAKGLFSDKFVSLGHRRLSIIGLNEASNQPMQSINDDIVIVFNGEIYNHEEIRKELENEFKFKTENSDTEVIINSYKKWGIKCIDRFIGMFAFCLYDRNKEKIYLVRDRLGKKPLFFTNINNTIYFSSESQAFFKANILDKKINSEAVYHYLSFLTVPAPLSFFDKVEKVEAGYYHEISKKGVKKTQYWNISDFLNDKIDHTFNEALKNTQDLLDKAMVHRNVADVPISIALSGGIDSSLNLYYTKLNRTDETCSINIAFEKDSRGNESLAAKKFSEQQDVKFIGKVLSQDEFIDWINGYLNISKDCPAGDPNTALMFGISKIARENNFKVMLVGEGGDEIGGYPVYFQLNTLNKLFKYIPSILFKALKLLPRNSLTRKIHRAVDSPLYAARFIFGFPENEKKTFWKKNSYDSYKIIKRLSDEVETD